MTTSEKMSVELREASGAKESKDKLLAFFYLLLRDELPAGKVSRIFKESILEEKDFKFTNGFLVTYAEYMIERLRPPEDEEGLLVAIRVWATEYRTKLRSEQKEGGEFAEGAGYAGNVMTDLLGFLRELEG